MILSNSMWNLFKTQTILILILEYYFIKWKTIRFLVLMNTVNFRYISQKITTKLCCNFKFMQMAGSFCCISWIFLVSSPTYHPPPSIKFYWFSKISSNVTFSVKFSAIPIKINYSWLYGLIVLSYIYLDYNILLY